MYIPNSAVQLIMAQVRVEYSGCHAPHSETPLYGRRAYFRLYIGDDYIAKVTVPVKTMNPHKATLDKLLLAEVKRRIEAIGPELDLDRYGCMRVVDRDPYGVKRLLDLVEGKYIDQECRRAQRSKGVA